MFHSYENPNHLCAECDQNGDAIITCGAASNTNADTNCGLRFIYCLRPHSSDIIDVPLPGQFPLPPGTDDITFTEGPITQIGNPNAARGNNIWNRPNPFTQELRLWPVSYHSVIPPKVLSCTHREECNSTLLCTIFVLQYVYQM